MTPDALAPRRAKSREERDEAMCIVQWIRCRAKERIARAHNVRGRILMLIAKQIADNFLPPLESP